MSLDAAFRARPPLPVLPTLSGVAIALAWLNPLLLGPDVSLLNSAVALAVAVLLALAALQARGPWREAAASATLAAASLSAAFGLVQYFGGAQDPSGWLAWAPSGVAYGNLRQRNHLASLTSLGLCALVWLSCQRDARGPGPGAWLLLVLLTFGNAATGSRTGLLEWLLLLGLWSVWGRAGGRADARRSWRLVAGGLLVYGLASVALPLLHGQMGAGGDPAMWRFTVAEGCASRLTLWSNVLHLIAQRPWTGWGWGELAYAHFVTLFPGERFCAILDNAHNLPLHLAVTLGLPLALAACAALAGWLWRMRPWAESDPARQFAWAMLAVIGLHSLLEYPLWYGPFQLSLGLCLLLLHVRAGPFPPAARVLAQALAALALVGLAYVAWDYLRVSQLYLPPSQRWTAYREDTMAKVRPSWLFQRHVDFAALTTTSVTADNAAQVHALALTVLHFSPEPRVVERLIDSATLLGQDEEAAAWAQRFRAAFPEEHADWQARQSASQPGLSRPMPQGRPRNCPTCLRASPGGERR